MGSSDAFERSTRSWTIADGSSVMSLTVARKIKDAQERYSRSKTLMVARGHLGTLVDAQVAWGFSWVGPVAIRSSKTIVDIF